MPAALAADPRIWVDEQHLAGRLAAVESPPIAILDFDETLWLRNSTEEFLAQARPSVVAAIILQTLGILKPWRWLSRSHPDRYRDSIRVGVIVALMPWTLLIWRHAAQRLGPKHFNTPLLRSVEGARPHRIAVATFGFDFVVRPLLAAADTRIELLLSATVWSAPSLRRIGKARALERLLDRTELKGAIFVSDSDIDRDIEEVCSRPFYIRWENAQYRQAGMRPLLPLAYTAKVKRPNERYILHGIIGYDLTVGFLAYALAAPNIIGTAVAFGFYLLGFFAVYEIGYYENDTKAQKRESKPVLSATFAELNSHFSVRAAWMFGLVLLTLGAAIQTLAVGPGLDRPWSDTFNCFAGHWALAVGLVIATRLTFRWFNTLTPRRRIIPMLGLQLERTLGYALMLPITWVGALLCVCHAFGRWFPYAIYRFGGDRKGFPSHLFAFLLFACVSGVIALAQAGAIEEFASPQFLVILAYLALRAAKDGLSFHKDRG